MKQLLLLFAFILFANTTQAQDPNPDDLLFEINWISWSVGFEDDFYERPTPNSEWDFITMDIAFTDPFSFSAAACGTISFNFTIIEGDTENFTALVSDVIVEPDPCSLAVNQEYSDAYFGFLQSLEGEVAEFQIGISSPSGPELGPVSLQITHPNNDYALWADIPLNVSEFLLSKLELYPNPASDILQWNLDNTNVNLAQVYSIEGRLLITKYVRENSLQVAELPAGIYFLKLTSEEGQMVKRFVKN